MGTALGGKQEAGAEVCGKAVGVFAVYSLVAGHIGSLLPAGLRGLIQHQGVVDVEPGGAVVLGEVNGHAVIHGNEAAVVHAEVLFALAAQTCDFTDYCLTQLLGSRIRFLACLIRNLFAGFLCRLLRSFLGLRECAEGNHLKNKRQHKKQRQELFE